MKKLSDSEIEAGILEIVRLEVADQYVSDLKVTVIKNMPSNVLVEVTAMYSAPGQCTEALLQKITDFLGGTSAEKYDDISNGGCETCDYWSSYGFAIRVW